MQSAACARSDVGRVRTTNEDFYAVRPELGLYLVADGMGGHGNGEVASRLAMLAACRYFKAARSQVQAVAGEGILEGLVRESLLAANRAILAAVESDPLLSGMGATAVALVEAGSQAVIAHVGDSRAYRFRNGTLELLTQDHTWVNEQVTMGELTLEAARQHPFRNVVTRALGGEALVSVDVSRHSVEPGDLFLLCTDGLTAVLEESQIAQALEDGPDPEPTCRRLIQLANRGGGPDNVTVLLVAYGRP